MKTLWIITLLAITAAGCQTSDPRADAASPPDAKAVILANKGRIFKDPDSVKAASITPPRRHMGFMWHVCVRANAKNGFGAYAGEKDMLIGIYDDGKPPSILMTDATGYCDFPHDPFPEIEAGYIAPTGSRPKV